MSLTRLAHQLIREHFADKRAPMELAVDATCGNGHDTEFLARLGFIKIVGFDIQKQAITATRQRLKHAKLGNVTLVHDGHQSIRHYITSPINCVMFNLGYLPQGEKSITTLQHTSVAALKDALSHLAGNGFVSILCYPGHPQGKSETNAIVRYVNSLTAHWQISEHLSSAPNDNSPVLYCIRQRL